MKYNARCGVRFRAIMQKYGNTYFNHSFITCVTCKEPLIRDSACKLPIKRRNSATRKLSNMNKYLLHFYSVFTCSCPVAAILFVEWRTNVSQFQSRSYFFPLELFCWQASESTSVMSKLWSSSEINRFEISRRAQVLSTQNLGILINSH